MFVRERVCVLVLEKAFRAMLLEIEAAPELGRALREPMPGLDSAGLRAPGPQARSPPMTARKRTARLRVSVAMGTRPEAIKLLPVVAKLREHADEKPTRLCAYAQEGRHDADPAAGHHGLSYERQVVGGNGAGDVDGLVGSVDAGEIPGRLAVLGAKEEAVV